MNEAKQWELIGQIEGIIRNPLLDIGTKIASLEYILRKYQKKCGKKGVIDLNKYYKHDRYRGRGEEAANHILLEHRKDFLEDGLDWISRHDSVTGTIVSFYTDTCEFEFEGTPYWLAKEVGK